MTENAKLLFLGTGASSGVPVIACTCAVCISQNKKDKRLRTSALITHQDKTILIDAGPDVRRQALRYGIEKIDGLILTHTHFDHVGGLEELRIFNFLQKGPIPCVLSSESLQDLKQLFFYIFSKRVHGKNFTSEFDFHILDTQTDLTELAGLTFSSFCYTQGGMKVLGLRFGNLAYLTDIKHYREDIFTFLEGVDTLVVSALRFTPAELHFTIDDAIDFTRRVGAKKSYLIHLSHDILYDHVESLLPEGMHLAYDGLEIPFLI